ncbi:MAG: 50S ribosomal protein L11 methyltransferase [Cyanophyceae cyanobacterium]
MRWWKIEVQCSPEQEESVFYRLDEFGCRGTATEVQGETLWVRGYLPQEETAVAELEALAQRLRKDAAELWRSPLIDWDSLDEEDWANSWKQDWQPTPVGDRFLVCPAWLSPAPDEQRTVIRLDPGAAFGTGTHPTTQLCLAALASCLNEAPLLADIGCGSGILSIGALLLGAQRVYAVDLDPLAVSATANNRQLNHLEETRLLVEQGSIEKIAEKVDGVMCNILAPVIVQLIPQLSRITKPHSWGLLSGILGRQVNDVAAVLQQHRWTIAQHWQQQEWSCLKIVQNLNKD